RIWAKRVAMTAVCGGCLFFGMQIEQARGRSGNNVANNSSTAVVPAVSETSNEQVATELVAKNGETGGDDEATGHMMKGAFADWPTPIEVPVVETDDDDASDLLEQSAVSEEMRQAWASAGYLIHEDRKYVPVPLGNGREGIAPISDIVIEYVGTEEYQ